MVLKIKGKHSSCKMREQRWRWAPLLAATLLTFIAGQELPPVGLQVGGNDVAEAVGQDVLCLVVDVFPAVRTCLNRSYHTCYWPRVTGEPSDQGRARINRTPQHHLPLRILLSSPYIPLFLVKVHSRCYLPQLMTLPDLAAQIAAFMCTQLGKQQVSEQDRTHTGDVKISHCVWTLMASKAFLTKAN